MLSKRLFAVASKVDIGKVVFDVGSDHAMLPSFLVLNGICPKAYAGDNKIGPLNRAKETIKKLSLEGKVIPLLSDGLDEAPDDVDIVTISGMGFYTVLSIFDKADLKRYKKIVCQVNRNVPELRRYISEHHYSIIDECVVYDEFYYEIVVFNCEKGNELNELEINYGPLNLVRKEKEFIDYLYYNKAKLEEINVKNQYSVKINEMETVLADLLNI